MTQNLGKNGWKRDEISRGVKNWILPFLTITSPQWTSVAECCYCMLKISQIYNPLAFELPNILYKPYIEEKTGREDQKIRKKCRKLGLNEANFAKTLNKCLRNTVTDPDIIALLRLDKNYYLLVYPRCFSPMMVRKMSKMV